MEDVSYILCFTWKRDIFEVPLLIVFRNLGPYSYWLLESKRQIYFTISTFLPDWLPTREMLVIIYVV